MVKNLKYLLDNIEWLDTIGSLDRHIAYLKVDSRAVQEDDVFIAVSGTQVDGHQFIGKAIENGARVIVGENEPGELPDQITFIRVADSASAVARMAEAFYDFPSAKMNVVGITGTNGKTTTATLLFELFKKAGFKVGLLSTVAYLINEKSIEATHTTPDAIRISELMDEMVREGCEYCFMEVSSHAIHQKRIDGLTFKGAVFTNITHDHLDYHHTFDEYLRVKKLLFDHLPGDAIALINRDDKNGQVMVQNTSAKVFNYALRSASDFHGKIIEQQLNGMLVSFDRTEVWTTFLGTFNAYNLLAVYAMAYLLGIDKQQVLTVLSGLKPVAGRFDYVNAPSGVTAVVDYAHTPDALLNVLETVNEVVPVEQQIITVVGAGGDRDVTKRPLMARIAASNSSKLVLTSDNPRTEDPHKILDEMQAGLDEEQLSRTIVIEDRYQAIKAACAMAKKGDLVLVAGKGHEDYQEVHGVKHHFDDKEVLKEILKLK